MMNEVSIILNGVRYDAVDMGDVRPICKRCDLDEYCKDCNPICNVFNVGDTVVFKRAVGDCEGGDG